MTVESSRRQILEVARRLALAVVLSTGLGCSDEPAGPDGQDGYHLPTPVELTLLSQWYHGLCLAVFVEGNTAYVGNGRMLDIVNVSTPSQPRRVGQIELGSADVPSIVKGIHVASGYAYVAMFQAGLRVVDVRSPTNPVEVGTYQITTYGRNQAEGVSVTGNHAYVFYGGSGVRILDVSTPSNPVEVGEFEDVYYVYGGVSLGDVVYAHRGSAGTIIIDVTTPSNPVAQGVFGPGQNVSDVHVSGGLAYTAQDFNLYVYDVTAPSNPALIGRVTFDQLPRALHVAGGYAYVGLDGYDELHVIDVGDPANPMDVGSIPLDANGWPEDAFVANDRLFIANRGSGLWIMDIGDPRAPVMTGIHSTGDQARAIDIQGAYAYIADRMSGLRILDISDPHAPREVSAFRELGLMVDVAVAGDYAYTSWYPNNESDQSLNAMRIVDVSDPAAPHEVGSFTIGPSSIHVDGTIAYLAAWNHGLPIVDVSTPSNPVEIGMFDRLAAERDVVVSGNYAYLVWVEGVGGGLSVLDVSDPTTPAEVGVVELGDSPGAVYYSGGYAYVKTGSGFHGRLVIIDVTTPEAPKEIGSVGLAESESWGEVQVLGDHAYVADGTLGVQVIDTSNKSRPLPVGLFETEGETWGVRVLGTRVYVADGSRGVVILQAE